MDKWYIEFNIKQAPKILRGKLHKGNLILTGGRICYITLDGMAIYQVSFEDIKKGLEKYHKSL